MAADGREPIWAGIYRVLGLDPNRDYEAERMAETVRQWRESQEREAERERRETITAALEDSARSSEKARVSDHDPPETPTKAARTLIGWFAGGMAFQCIETLHSGYWPSLGYGVGAVVVAIFDFKLPVIFAKSPGLTRSLNRVAADARWWTAIGLLSLFMISASPFIEQGRWPYVHWFGYGKKPPTLSQVFLPTSLRLQFNNTGDKPQEISSQNVDWSWDAIAEATQTPKPPCPSGGLLFQTDCSTIAMPQYDYGTKITWIIFLTYLSPLTQGYDVKVDAHGAKMPKWQAYQADNRMVYLEFDGDLTRMVLDINILPKK